MIKTLMLPICMAVIVFSNQILAKCTTEIVKKELTIWQHIYNLNDPIKLSSFYAKDAQFAGAFEQEFASSNKEIENYFIRLFKKEGGISRSFKVNLLESKQNFKENASTVIVNGIYELEITENGKSKTLPIRYTMIWTDTEEGCRLVSHHASTHQKK